MSTIVKIGTCVLGEGMPKICAPIVGRSMDMSPIESRERVKGGTPLQGAGAAPLPESRGRASGGVKGQSPLGHSFVSFAMRAARSFA